MLLHSDVCYCVHRAMLRRREEDTNTYTQKQQRRHDMMFFRLISTIQTHTALNRHVRYHILHIPYITDTQPHSHGITIKTGHRSFVSTCKPNKLPVQIECTARVAFTLVAFLCNYQMLSRLMHKHKTHTQTAFIQQQHQLKRRQVSRIPPKRRTKCAACLSACLLCQRSQQLCRLSCGVFVFMVHNSVENTLNKSLFLHIYMPTRNHTHCRIIFLRFLI